MIEFYPQIKLLHITFAVLSGSVFLLRGGAVLAGMRWPHQPVVRISSYIIDSVLLLAALLLLSILPGAMFGNGWLTTKLVLLVIYIVLGTLAIKRARTWRVKAICYVGALLSFGMIYSIARAHHPLGVLHAWFG